MEPLIKAGVHLGGGGGAAPLDFFAKFCGL